MHALRTAFAAATIAAIACAAASAHPSTLTLKLYAENRRDRLSGGADCVSYRTFVLVCSILEFKICIKLDGGTSHVEGLRHVLIKRV